MFLNASFDDIVYSTGEIVYSTTKLSMPTLAPSSVDLFLTKSQELDPLVKIRVTSLTDSNDWFEGYPTNTSPTSINITITDHSGIIPTTSLWEIDYVSEQPHIPANYAKASDINYWINKGFIEFTETATQNVGSRGFLPSNYDENSFNLNNLKIGLDGLTVPLHQPVFAAVSNIESKKEIVWTLTLNGSIVVQIKSSSYFIWRFASPGDYMLSAEVTDTNNNKYTLSREFNAVDARSITTYRNYIEKTLNRRKALM
jgi:hypothetical protein